jgi:hypothetical protein
MCSIVSGMAICGAHVGPQLRPTDVALEGGRSPPWPLAADKGRLRLGAGPEGASEPASLPPEATVNFMSSIIHCLGLVI